MKVDRPYALFTLHFRKISLFSASTLGGFEQQGWHFGTGKGPARGGGPDMSSEVAATGIELVSWRCTASGGCALLAAAFDYRVAHQC
jgi:hypothetical protein